MKLTVQFKTALLYTGLIFTMLCCSNAARSQVRMRGTLFLIDNTGNSILLDGNLTVYDNQYSNAVDGYDIWKFSNFGENMGLLRDAANLVIERRSRVLSSDTTFFRLWNLQQRHYRMQIITENMQQDNFSAVLRDSYLGTDTPVSLNDTTDLDFFVTTQAGSYASNRFSFIYSSANLISLPVTFTAITAVRQADGVLISWQVENEAGVIKYQVEKSTDGSIFRMLNEISAAASGTGRAYRLTDKQANETTAFYRVKAVSNGGQLEYSSIARINTNKAEETVSIYPNPVRNRVMNIKLDGSTAAEYKLTIVHFDGVQQVLPSIYSGAGQYNGTVVLPASLAPGIYQLRILTPKGKAITKTFSVL
jgi:hypothetical protein